MRKYNYIILFILLSTNAFSQFTIDGELRPRTEFRNGYKQLRDSDKLPAIFTSQRSRLNLAHQKEGIESYLSFQDIRIWGDEKLKADIAMLNIFQAWTKIKLTEAITLKLGRQTLNYDNGRLFSQANWNQVSSSHDGLMFLYKKNNLDLHFFTAFNQKAANTFGTDYSGINHYKSLNVLWLSKKINNVTLSFINITDGNQKVGTANTVYLRNTIGGILNHKKEKSVYNLRGFYQLGKNKIGQTVNAFYFNGETSYGLSEKTAIKLGVEVKSGTNFADSLNLEDNAFDILYGARHKFNGIIDYFNLPATSGNAGLVDPYVHFNYKLNKKTSFSLQYHYLLLQNNFVNAGEIIDNYLGSEFDLITKVKVRDDVTLEAGYAFLSGTKSMEIIKGGDKDLFQHYLYFMITVKPVFFTTKTK